MMRVRATTLLLTVLTVGAAGAACGISDQEAAATVDLSLSGDVMPGPSSPGQAAAPAEASVAVYMIGDNQLVRTVLSIEPTSPLPDSIINRLSSGPTQEEDSHLWSAVPPSTVLRSASTSAGIVSVNLSREFTSIGGQDEILAVAQIVLSVASLPGVTGVEFFVEGQATDVPGIGGALIVRAATFDDYRDLLNP